MTERTCEQTLLYALGGLDRRMAVEAAVGVDIDRSASFYALDGTWRLGSCRSATETIGSAHETLEAARLWHEVCVALLAHLDSLLPGPDATVVRLVVDTYPYSQSGQSTCGALLNFSLRPFSPDHPLSAGGRLRAAALVANDPETTATLFDPDGRSDSHDCSPGGLPFFLDELRPHLAAIHHTLSTMALTLGDDLASFFCDPPEQPAWTVITPPERSTEHGADLFGRTRVRAPDAAAACRKALLRRSVAAAAAGDGPCLLPPGVHSIHRLEEGSVAVAAADQAFRAVTALLRR